MNIPRNIRVEVISINNEENEVNEVGWNAQEDPQD